ncbi:MAG: rod shape-determining protein MreD [Gaiellaceae bacterium]
MRLVLKTAVIVFLSAILQVSWFDGLSLGLGSAGLLLVVVVSLALLRGSVVGAGAGFAAGLCYDIATYGQLGLTSLLLTLAGFWTGRYGETTGRDRAHAPFLSVVVITVLYELGGLTVRFLIGEPAPFGKLVLGTLPGELVLNLILTAPVYVFCRWAVGKQGDQLGASEVRVLA